MKTSKQIVLTLLLSVGMAVLGAVTGLMAPAVPVLAGLAAAFAGCAAARIGQVGGVLGLMAYGAGLCAAMLVLQPGWLGLAVWYAAFLLLGHVLTQVLLHKKLPLAQVMLQTAAWLLMAGMASYIALYYITGDGVGLVVATVEAELAAAEEISPQIYDAMLSALSVRGFLPDVGLETYVWELDAHTRMVLTAGLVEMFDESLRLSVMDILVNQAMHIGLIAPLLTVLAYARAGKGDQVSKVPNLSDARVPRRVAAALFILVVVCLVLMLLVESAAPVYVAGMTIFEFVYAVQGLSMGEWFLRRKGVGRGLRTFLLWLAFLLLPGVLFFIGFMEQMFRFREIQKLKDSGEWQRMSREYEAYMEEMQKERDEERERRKAERRGDEDDDDSKKM